MADIDEISLPSSIDSDIEIEDDKESPGISCSLSPTGPVAFMEIYSSPRIAPFCQRLLLQCGPSIDLKTGFDLTKQYFQQQVLSQLATLQPLVIMLSPPCAVFSQVQNTLQHRRKDLDLWKARFAEGLALFMFALMVFKAQVVAGRYAVLEHPWLASSWALPAVQNLLNTVANIRVLVFDQCLLGLRTTVRQLPVRKRTKLLTNWPGISPSPCLNVRCSAETCNHVPMSHAWLQGAEGGVSRCRSAQEYPDTFCANFASSVKAQVLANVAAPGLVEAESDSDLSFDLSD